MKAVIMAGGRGTRLRPLTCQLPKPMVPVMGIPVLEQIIDLLKREGITELAITSFYRPELIEDYFGSGRRFGVEIEYFVEEDPLGTAGSVRNTGGFLDQSFIVISGDALTDFKLRQAVDFHRSRKAAATLLLTRVQNPLEYGVVMTDGNGRITRFLEKPGWGQVFSDTVNTGIYVLEPEVMELVDEGEKVDFSRDLFPALLARRAPLYGCVMEGYWSDIGTLDQYRQTHWDLLEGGFLAALRGDLTEESEGIFIEEGVEIDPQARLKAPLFLGAGSIIEEGTLLQGSVIGRGNTIRRGSNILRSILWQNNYLGAYSEVTASILAGNSTLGEHVNLTDDVVLGSRVSVGSYATINAGVRVWPEKSIAPRSTLSQHLVWRKHYARSFFGSHGARGRANLELTPDFAARLGSAFASLFPEKKSFILSFDSYPVSENLAHALQAGILSTGSQIINCGPLNLPVTRASIRSLPVSGGVHLQLNSSKGEEILIQFFDEQGINLTTARERKVERIFDRGAFKRAPLEEIKTPIFRRDMEREYLSGLEEMAEDRLAEEGFRVIYSASDRDSSRILRELFSPLGVEMISSPGGDSGQDFHQRERLLDRIASMVRESDVDLGLIMDQGGEELTLITHQGRVIDEDRLEVILSLLLLEEGVKELVIPVTAPAVIDGLARAEGVAVTRTGAHHYQVLRQHFKLQGTENPYCPIRDGNVLLIRLLLFLAREDITLEELAESIPPFYRAEEKVDCAFQQKGRVLRSIVEERESEELELIDGVRIDHAEGWTLILPDGELPLFHVYAEAPSPEEASRLVEEYTAVIDGLI